MRYKKVIKKTLIKILDPVAKRLGYKHHLTYINPYAKNTLLKGVFDNFSALGFEPKHIVDVGANHGTWTREILKYVPDAYYTLLEPQNWLQPSFQDILNQNKKVEYYPVGAGKEEGSFNFTIVNRDDSCSFRYTEKEAKEKGFKQIEISVITLNELVKNTNKPFPDLVKIDAEGLDIEVLEGASDLFGKTEVFMVEAAVFCKSFDNTIYKLIHYMEKEGYVVFDITALNRPFKPRVLWLMELVFVRKDGVLNTCELI